MLSLLVGIYCALLFGNYALLRQSARQNKIWGNLAFFAPILVLIVVKYFPFLPTSVTITLSKAGSLTATEFFVGVSYMAFRLSRLAREVQSEIVPMPTIWEYTAFAFFVPTIWIGPISRYSTFHRSISKPMAARTPATRSLTRILVGLTKYLFLATLVNQFTYDGLLLDGHPHSIFDLSIAIFAYTAYLYCNFSGFCDIVVGVSGLVKIEVDENFDQPFMSRNLQEFWTRWHMTLSSWFRDMMFTPMLKGLVRYFGPNSINYAVAAIILLVFLTVGMWHGTGLNFAVFGLAQGFGLVIVHYYNLYLRRRLGRNKYLVYQRSKLIRAGAILLTVSYFSISLFFFANTREHIHRIFRILI